jgi:hypothetical protein
MTTETLKQTRPEIAITTSWEYDPYFQSHEDFPLEDGFRPRVMIVTATAIKDGVLYEGKAYLGICHSKYIRKDNPEVMGHIPQMIEEAVAKLDSGTA